VGAEQQNITSMVSFRDGPKDQTRNLEVPGSMLCIAPERRPSSFPIISVDAIFTTLVERMFTNTSHAISKNHPIACV
jgi:hypothetical protein